MTTQAVYLDFAKALDTINPYVLITKLRKLGITGKTLKLIRSYLSNRKQFVDIDGYHSGCLSVTSGVPQGSLLGPLLFLVNVYDLPDEIVNQIFSFADDTKLLAATHRSSNNMQDGIDRLQNWSTASFIDFNVEKCAVLNFLCSSPTNVDECLVKSLFKRRQRKKT